MTQESDPPAKRRKLNADLQEPQTTPEHNHLGLARPISPPLASRRKVVAPNSGLTPTWSFDSLNEEVATSALPEPSAKVEVREKKDILQKTNTKYELSPIQLTRIEDLAPHENVDAVGLHDILGDPLIKECWYGVHLSLCEAR